MVNDTLWDNLRKIEKVPKRFWWWKTLEFAESWYSWRWQYFRWIKKCEPTSWRVITCLNYCDYYDISHTLITGNIDIFNSLWFQKLLLVVITYQLQFYKITTIFLNKVNIALWIFNITNAHLWFCTLWKIIYKLQI